MLAPQDRQARSLTSSAPAGPSSRGGPAMISIVTLAVLMALFAAEVAWVCRC
jgi:hypothetical protein